MILKHLHRSRRHLFLSQIADLFNGLPHDQLYTFFCPFQDPDLFLSLGQKPLVLNQAVSLCYLLVRQTDYQLSLPAEFLFGPVKLFLTGSGNPLMLHQPVQLFVEPSVL